MPSDWAHVLPLRYAVLPLRDDVLPLGDDVLPLGTNIQDAPQDEAMGACERCQC